MGGGGRTIIGVVWKEGARGGHIINGVVCCVGRGTHHDWDGGASVGPHFGKRGIKAIWICLFLACNLSPSGLA